MREIRLVQRLDDFMAPRLNMIAATLAVVSLIGAIVALRKITPEELYRILPFS